MDQRPDFRRRRIILALAAVVMVLAGRSEEPRIGTVSIAWNDDRAMQVDADLVPPLDAVVAGVVMVAERALR